MTPQHQYIVEVLLPLNKKDGGQLPLGLFEEIKSDLAHAFGGVTAFSRAPAEGQWRNDEAMEHDDIVVLEVMTHRLDRKMWTELRKRLERDFDQEEIVIRAHAIERL